MEPLSRRSYPVVKHGHVTPVVYLQGFANGGGSIREHRVDGSREPRDRPPRKVATRPRFYRRRRPVTGVDIDDVEACLNVIESNVAHVFHGLPDNWPLHGDDRMKLASFCAVQLVRVPGWMDWHEKFTRETFGADRVDAVTAGKLTTTYARALNDVEAYVLDDTPRLMAMLGIARKIVAIFASMCWTLVEFDHPLIATSDQPVVVWPLAERALAPVAVSHSTGLLETLEVRLPLTPRHVLLMTWSIDPSDEGDRVRGHREHAANVNAFTIANADRDWFSLPGFGTPRGSGRLLPIAPALIRGYSAATAWSSFHRAEVTRQVQPLIGREIHELDEITVVKVSQPSA